VTVEELIRLRQNQLTSLNNLMATATALGDIAQIEALEVQISQTELAITQLQDSL
jgi:hypothetical protein